MNGVGEGNLGMVITFCHHNQAKVEASEVLSALYQCDSLEPNVVVVKRLTNSPYLPWGSFGFLYLDVTTLFGGTSFPLDQLHLCRLLPYSDTKVVLPWEEGEEGLKVYPFFQETLWKSSEKEHCLSIQYYYQFPHCSPSPSRRGLPDGGRIWLSPGPIAVTGHQPGKSPAGMGVIP